MYILKNAFRCIGRSKGRNILIGIIVLVIAFAACIGLSIRQAAISAKEDTLARLSVTATISFDRRSAMDGMTMEPSDEGGKGSFDKDSFKELMGESSSLTLEEYETYAVSESVQDFYYSMSVSANGSDSFGPVSTSDDSETSGTLTAEGENDFSSFGRGKDGMMQFSSSDFEIVGYSSDTAMTDFTDGIASIEEGTVFDEGTESYDCIITQELATYNGLAVGDTVTVTNPDNEADTYTLSVVGIYTTTESNTDGFSMMGRGMTSNDPANKIYMSYNALAAIVSNSETVCDDGDDETEAMSGSLDATYTFADVEAYETFEEDVRTLGLDDSYTVSSSDITAFENSLTPLNTLSTMAGWFLLVILIIGTVILVVLNIFNVRERKYEIGVLTAMGMKKGKVAMQFMTELFTVTLIAVIFGAVIGGVCSVPVTNALLEAQTTSQSSRAEQMTQNFGRDNNAMPGGFGGGMQQDETSELPSEMPSGGIGGMFNEMLGGASDYVTEVNSAMNLTVVLQMLGIAMLLTLVAGAVAVLFVMRYEPLKILANRD